MTRTLTPQDIRYLFDYSDEGVLTWAATSGKKTCIGAVAGYKAPDGYVITIAGKKIARRRLVWAWHHGVWPTNVRGPMNML